MSINGEQQVFRIAEIRAALNCANSTIYRMIARGEITAIDTPIGKRITAAEFERLRGGKRLHLVHEPDPKRRAMAAHARSAKTAAKAEAAKVASISNELTVFMDEMRRALPRIEAAVTERLDRIEERITEKSQPPCPSGAAGPRAAADGRDERA